jgi:hypothetical protein
VSLLQQRVRLLEKCLVFLVYSQLFQFCIKLELQLRVDNSCDVDDWNSGVEVAFRKFANHQDIIINQYDLLYE